MSRKDKCWDNAYVACFFYSMKVEAVQYEPIMNSETMRQHIFESIEIDYNKKRRHSALDYSSPGRFEQLNVLKDASIFTGSGKNFHMLFC